MQTRKKRPGFQTHRSGLDPSKVSCPRRPACFLFPATAGIVPGLLPRRELWKLPSLKSKRFYERLFTPIVTLWYLIFQRLAFDHTLEGVVADAQAGGADSLCKRLSKSSS